MDRNSPSCTIYNDQEVENGNHIYLLHSDTKSINLAYYLGDIVCLPLFKLNELVEIEGQCFVYKIINISIKENEFWYEVENNDFKEKLENNIFAETSLLKYEEGK